MLDSFKEFFDKHALTFADAPTQPASEQNLEYYELFQRYLRLYEELLSDYIQTLDCTVGSRLYAMTFDDSAYRRLKSSMNN